MLERISYFLKKRYLVNREINHPIVDVEEVEVEENQDLFAFIETNIDSDRYYELYPDVAFHKVDAGEHWFKYGILEGRIFPGFDYDLADGHENVDSVIIKNSIKFKYRDKSVTFTAKKIPPEIIIEQINRQSFFEPSLLAAGYHAIKNLRVYEACDIYSRDGVRVDELYKSINEIPDIILIIPFLEIGGAEKYSADIFRSLSHGCRKKVLIIVTDQHRVECPNWKDLNIFRGIDDSDVIFWKDYTNTISYADPAPFGRFLASLNTNSIFVVNSALGLKAVAMFGRGLSQSTRIFCAFFSVSEKFLGASYGAYYPRKIAEFATCITDNEVMAAHLKRLYGGLLEDKIEVLRPCVQIATEELLAARISARKDNYEEKCSVKKWCYVGRISIEKGSRVFGILARMRPDDFFYLFGPLEGSKDNLKIDEPNIITGSSINDVTTADFSHYDGFLFPSQFEGMPNVVLEMTQHMIPIISTDVGGLRDTFSDNDLLFASASTSAEQVAVNFNSKMENLSSMSVTKRTDLVRCSQKRVADNHSLSNHCKTLLELVSYDD